MATVNRFEDLEVWINAREIAKKTNDLILKHFKNEFALANQLRRSTGSVMDNIAEGFERNGNKEFLQFLFIAKGSAGESRSQLIRALDLKYIPEKEFIELNGQIIELSSRIQKMITYLKTSNYKGSKYKP